MMCPIVIIFLSIRHAFDYGSESLSSSSKQSPKKSDKIQENSDDYGGDTDVDDSGDDTEDEIRRIKQKQAGISDTKEYDDSTDEDDENSGLPELPDFFSDKYFYLYGTFSASDRRVLVRYVTAYNGEIEEYMNEKVNYVVTMDEWDKKFDDALSDYENIVFVKPKWIFQCHEKTKLIPHQPYIVVP